MFALAFLVSVFLGTKNIHGSNCQTETERFLKILCLYFHRDRAVDKVRTGTQKQHATNDYGTGPKLRLAVSTHYLPAEPKLTEQISDFYLFVCFIDHNNIFWYTALECSSAEHQIAYFTVPTFSALVQHSLYYIKSDPKLVTISSSNGPQGNCYVFNSE